MLAIPRMRSGVKIPSMNAMSAMGISVILVVLSPQFSLGHRLESHPLPPSQCTGTHPKVCLYPEHHHVNKRTLSYVTTLTKAVKSAGYDALVPKRVDVVSRTYRPTNADIQGIEVDPDGYNSGTVDIRVIADELITPLHCKQLYNDSRPPEESYWQRKHSLTKTLLSAAGVEFYEEDYIPGSKVVSPDEAARIMKDFKECKL
jgi:hypothetical protein